MIDEPIIIKKRRAKKHKGGHGGAWKVAFADFTLAMMALFMVLWVMNISEPGERTLIVQHLNSDLFDPGKMSFFDSKSTPTLIDLEGNLANKQTVMPTNAEGDGSGQGRYNDKNPSAFKVEDSNGLQVDFSTLVPGEYASVTQLKSLFKDLTKAATKIALNHNISMSLIPQGIKIIIHDSDKKDMFKVGQVEMQPYFEDLLFSLAPILGKIKNKISIVGHTDSLPYNGKQFTNWELSSERALMARRALAYGGMKQNQFLQVIGMANMAPLNKEAPNSPENRRIDILVMTKAASDKIIKDIDRVDMPIAVKNAKKISSDSALIK